MPNDYYYPSVAEVAFLEARNEMAPGSTARRASGQLVQMTVEAYRDLWTRYAQEAKRA